MLNGRVFFLGAGFSAGAGIPLTDRLLKLTMEMFQEECPAIFERVDNLAREAISQYDDNEIDYSNVNFSNLCTYLEYMELREHEIGEVASREKETLRYYLAKTIAKHTPAMKNIPDLYIEFAKQLSDNDIVVTFNWDLLLEMSLLKLGKEFTYNWGKPNVVQISKFHGSINWRLEKPISSSSSDALNWQPLHENKNREQKEIYTSNHLIKHTFWNKKHHSIDPFLVLPGYGKAFDVRYNAIYWYKPEAVFAFTNKDIFIVGLSLADDDFFIKSFFLSSLPYIQSYSSNKNRKIVIINPDKEISKNYSFLPSSNVEVYNEDFDLSHIEIMKKGFNG